MFKDLHFTLTYLRDFIAENDLLAAYKQLATDMDAAQGATEADANTIEDRINEMRDKIYTAHGTVNLLLMTPPQKAILKQIGAHPIIGQKAIKKIQKAFTRQTLNMDAVGETLTELQTKTTELNTRIQQTLVNFGIEEYQAELEEGQSYVEIAFDKNSGFSNFWESSERSKEWSFIFKAVADLTGEKYEDIQTVSWNSGCPQLGVWIASGATFASALVDVGKIAAKLKQLKDMIFKKKEDAEKLGAEEDAVKIVKESIERKFGKVYEEKKEKWTIELRKTYGKNSTRPQGDGDNFMRLALEKAVAQLSDGTRIIDPTEVRPTPTVETPDENGGTNGETLGQLYRENHQLGKEVEKYIEAETQKRLAARTRKMRKELALKVPEDKMKVTELRSHLKKAGLETKGSKAELLARYLKYNTDPEPVTPTVEIEDAPVPEPEAPKVEEKKD